MYCLTCRPKQLTRPIYHGAAVTVPQTAVAWPSILFMLSDAKPPAFSFGEHAFRTPCPHRFNFEYRPGMVETAKLETYRLCADFRLQCLPPCVPTRDGKTLFAGPLWPACQDLPPCIKNQMRTGRHEADFQSRSGGLFACAKPSRSRLPQPALRPRQLDGLVGGQLHNLLRPH